MTSDTQIYYDPFDVEIDEDPHPLWRPMRDEAPPAARSSPGERGLRRRLTAVRRLLR